MGANGHRRFRFIRLFADLPLAIKTGQAAGLACHSGRL